MADEKLKQEDMVPGVKYRGYGMLNPYKEFVFTPENTGSRAGRETMIANWSDDQVTLKQTKNFLIINMKLPRGSKDIELVKNLMAKFNKIFEFLRTHEI